MKMQLPDPGSEAEALIRSRKERREREQAMYEQIDMRKYEKAPSARYDHDPSWQSRYGGFRGGQEYPGLVMAGRHSAARRFYCPECHLPFHPVNMNRHRRARHQISPDELARWAYDG